ncbi:MAG: DUF998 domain-containing protein [Cyclobacteriaceae bacterium]
MSIAFALTYQLLAILAVILKPDLGVYWHTISEWAIGKYGWVMQAAFISSGLSYLFLFLSVKSEVSGRLGKTGLVFLFLCFVGTTLVGLFVTDPYPPDFTVTTTLVHTLGGTMGMLLLPVAAIFINRNLLKHNINFFAAKNILKWTAFLPLIALIGFIIHLTLFVILLGENAVGENVPIGYPPRFMFLIYHIWLFILTYILIKTKEKNA